jgi:hypothetical protein
MEGLAKVPKSDVNSPKYYKEATNDIKETSSFDSFLKDQLTNLLKEANQTTFLIDGILARCTLSMEIQLLLFAST